MRLCCATSIGILVGDGQSDWDLLLDIPYTQGFRHWGWWDAGVGHPSVLVLWEEHAWKWALCSLGGGDQEGDVEQHN